MRRTCLLLLAFVSVGCSGNSDEIASLKHELAAVKQALSSAEQENARLQGAVAEATKRMRVIEEQLADWQALREQGVRDAQQQLAESHRLEEAARQREAEEAWALLTPFERVLVKNIKASLTHGSLVTASGASAQEIIRGPGRPFLLDECSAFVRRTRPDLEPLLDFLNLEGSLRQSFYLFYLESPADAHFAVIAPATDLRDNPDKLLASERLKLPAGPSRRPLRDYPYLRSKWAELGIERNRRVGDTPPSTE